MGVVSSLGESLRRNAVRKGFLGGRRAWLVVGFLTYGWRILRRLTRPQASPLAAESLKPGDTLVIESVPREHRRKRRRSA